MRNLHLAAFLGNGPSFYHLGTWRHPRSEDYWSKAADLERLARTLEAAKFDAVFFADGLAINEEAAAKGGVVSLIDPIVIGAGIARATERIGIAMTVSTAFQPPYSIARTLGSLDHVSGGRIGWNVVTSSFPPEFRNFGLPGVPPRELRYQRAAEVVDATLALWDSFPPSALVADAESGEYIDIEQLHFFDFEGNHVRSAGPLNALPSPQGRPIIIQAGASDQGKDFAACYADVIFVMVHSAADIRAYVTDVRARAAAAGRGPDDIVFLALINVVIGDTEADAQEQWSSVNALVDADTGVHVASMMVGKDLKGLPLDQPLGEIEFGEEGSVGLMELLRSVSNGQRGDITLAEAAVIFANSAVPTIVGDPSQVADRIEQLHRESGAGGFMLSAPIMPAGLEDFARLVVPKLQERGLFRTDYPGTTFRSTLFS